LTREEKGGILIERLKNDAEKRIAESTENKGLRKKILTRSGKCVILKVPQPWKRGRENVPCKLNNVSERNTRKGTSKVAQDVTIKILFE